MLSFHKLFNLCIFEESPYTTEKWKHVSTQIHGHKDENICNEQYGQGPQNTSDIARPMLKVCSLYNDSPN